MIRTGKTILAISLLIAGSATADPVNEINHGATAFYRTYLAVRPSGVPTAKVLTKFAPVLSPSLAQLLRSAETAERRYAKVTRNEVPPLVEGDLFTSLFEGAQTFSIQECHRGNAGGAACTVELSYTESPGKTVTRWADKIYLIRSERHWVIDDIEFGGNWQFMHKGRLRELLRRVIRDGNNARPSQN